MRGCCAPCWPQRRCRDPWESWRIVYGDTGRRTRPRGPRWRGSSSTDYCEALKRLEVLDDRRALLLRQLVAEGVAAVAAARLRRVVHLAPLDGRQVRVRRPAQHAHLPAELLAVVVGLLGAVRAREHLGPGLRVQDVVDRRHRAVVEVRRRRPDAVQRRRLVAVRHDRPIAAITLLVREPALVIVVAELLRDALVALRVGA